MSRFETIWAYHEATKHHFDRYARSPGYLDWKNQPNPFRFYEGVPEIAFDPSTAAPDLAYDDLYLEIEDRTGDSLSLVTMGTFWQFFLGLSAWKAAGNSRWSLRINPSSGNLHPCEGYLIAPDMPGVAGGVYHYNVFKHTLERRANLPADIWPQLFDYFGSSGFLVALSTIFWREAWKYGERAYRYCNLDAGHALAAMAFAARLHRWQAICLSDVSDDQIRTLLGFNHTPWRSLEHEEPEMVCWIGTNRPVRQPPQALPDNWVQLFDHLTFSGTPNLLSPTPRPWSIITQTAAAAEKPTTAPAPITWETAVHPTCVPVQKPASTVIRQRRSAVRYNWRQFISGEHFWSILGRTLPVCSAAPFEVRLAPPAIHLVVFVHRVTGLTPGLYLLVRRAEMIAPLQTAMHSDFTWGKVREDFPFFLLAEQDVTFEAMELSCHQEIAGHSAFAVAMLAPFDQTLKNAPFRYRHLHWECGMIGQVLYLGAEAHGVRGTGIGCFFDDPVLELLGIRDGSFQSLYHFTIGHPVPDDRLTTLPAHHHLSR